MWRKDDFLAFIYGECIGDATPPCLLRLRSSNAFIIGTVAFTVFTDIFLYSAVVPILPFALTVRAGVAEDDLQRWTSVFLSVYGGAVAVGSLAIGWFADKITSRRTPLLLGLVALGTSSALLCAGSSLSVLIIGRALQGLSAAVVWTVGLVLLAETVNKAEMGQAMGYIFAATSAAQLAGPLLGGVVYAKAGYNAVFAIGFALVVTDILLRFLLIERYAAAQWYLANLASPFEDSIIGEPRRRVRDTCGDSKENPVSETPPTELVAIPLPNEIRKKTSRSKSKTCTLNLPPVLALLRCPRLLAALLGCFVESVAFASFDSVLPLFVKETFNWTSTGAGFIFACLVGPALASPIAGWLSDRYGPRWLATFGLLGTVPFWVLLRLVTYDSLGQKVLLCALLVGIGTCLTILMPPMLAEIDYVVGEQERKHPGSFGPRGAAAQAFGLFNLSFAVGALVGPLWAGFMVKRAGWGTMSWSLAALSGVAAVFTFVWTGGRINLRKTGQAGGDVV